MRRTELLQEVRRMRFLEAYCRWQRGYLTQEEAGELLGMSGASSRCAPVDEGLALCDLYSGHYSGWNVKHFFIGVITGERAAAHK
ncbi:hypothetical protein D6779_08510 [Candidatus Parcubacteria bacterium]|nr:MAG: hypothetical protein D6779_08510 [Candidatus Parcubacteria bacterium]